MRDGSATIRAASTPIPRVRVVVDDGRSFVRRSAGALRRHPGVAGRHLGRDRRRGVHPHREHALHRRGVQRLPRSPDRRRRADDHALGVRRPAAGVAGAGGVRAARLRSARRSWRSCSTDRVATFLLKKTPFTRDEIAPAAAPSRRELGFTVLYAPGSTGRPVDARRRGRSVDGARAGDYARLIMAPDRSRSTPSYPQDIRPTTDDRPFFFHTTKLARSVPGRVRPIDAVRQRPQRAADADGHLRRRWSCCSSSAPLVARAAAAGPRGWLAWLVYFGALGAGFMLIEVAVLQRFVLLLGHPVYSLTVTLFSLLLGTGLGAASSRRLGSRASAHGPRPCADRCIAVLALRLDRRWSRRSSTWAMPFPRPVRIAVAVADAGAARRAARHPDAGRHPAAGARARRRWCPGPGA